SRVLLAMRVVEAIGHLAYGPPVKHIAASILAADFGRLADEVRAVQDARAGADYISVHQEACPHLHAVVQDIRRLNVKPSVALNPATPLMMVEPILADLDMLLIMSVNPGFGGQQFIESTLDKLR